MTHYLKALNYKAAKTFILEKLLAELAPNLTYHGVHHTLDVLEVTIELCSHEKIPPYETTLLKTAALFHDSGFTKSYNNHEQTGCEIVKNNLPAFGYTTEEIERICGMIMATKIPQSPRNQLERIICDADLDYLGRNDFYEIGATLFTEFKAYGVLQSEKDWNNLQVKFLESHRYLTATNLRRRVPQKHRYLWELKKIVAGY